MTVEHVPEIWVRNMSDISQVFEADDILTLMDAITGLKAALGRV